MSRQSHLLRSPSDDVQSLHARMLFPDEVGKIATTWAKRLRHGRATPRFLYIGGLARSADVTPPSQAHGAGTTP